MNPESYEELLERLALEVKPCIEPKGYTPTVTNGVTNWRKP